MVLRWGEGLSPREARARAGEVLSLLGLGKKAHLRPAELSGGEKQRVAIARALAKQPQLLFADEPTSALDGENGQIVIRLLRKAATERGAAVIVVTHDHRLETFADRVIHIDDGRIASDERIVATETPFYHPQLAGAPDVPPEPALAGAWRCSVFSGSAASGWRCWCSPRWAPPAST